MKILEVNNKWIDPVKTEETICHQMRVLGEEFMPQWAYVQFSIAQNINRMGLHETQKVIDMIVKKYGRNNLFFVCQHIQAPRLNFQQRPVFCPHTTKNLAQRNFFPLPHFACNIDENKVLPWKNRTYLSNFQGSYRTHPIRNKVTKSISKLKNVKVVDTGAWFFEQKNRLEKKHSYIDLLGSSKTTLCPRGTGPSSIRFWESLAMGSVPILIADNLELPFEEHINWDEFVIRVPEAKAHQVSDFIPSSKYLKEMSEKGREIYKNNFSNQNLYKSVVNKLAVLNLR